MGRWMEAIDKKGTVVCEMSPVFIIHLSKSIPKSIRHEYPLLVSLDLLAPEWVDEEQIYSPKKCAALIKEIETFRSIINRETFIPGIDASKILHYWTSNTYQLSDINQNMNEIITFLQKSIFENLTTRICL